MTTAATTAFAHEVFESHGHTFFFDGNQKVTAENGSYEEPAANAFSILEKSDCPFHTPTCGDSCYVTNLKTYQPELYALYQHNSSEIRAMLQLDNTYMYDVAADVAQWITENCQGGFRWHVSGDLFCPEYAEWVATVVEETENVQHWIYTRSFPYIDPLLDLEDLTLNLSADKDNYWLARRYADKYDLRVCYLTVDGEVPDDLRDGDIIFPDYALRGVGQLPHTFRDGSDWWKGLAGRQKKMVCPVDVYGKSDQVRCGPCRKCIE